MITGEEIVYSATGIQPTPLERKLETLSQLSWTFYHVFTSDLGSEKLKLLTNDPTTRRLIDEHLFQLRKEIEINSTTTTSLEIHQSIHALQLSRAFASVMTYLMVALNQHQRVITLMRDHKDYLWKVIVKQLADETVYTFFNTLLGWAFVDLEFYMIAIDNLWTQIKSIRHSNNDSNQMKDIDSDSNVLM